MLLCTRRSTPTFSGSCDRSGPCGGVSDLLYDLHPRSVVLSDKLFTLHYILPLPYDAQMDLKHLSNLSIRDRGPNGLPNQLNLNNSSNTPPDRYLEKLKNYAKSLPYSIESNSRMQEMFDFICLRLCQCIEAKDFDPGFAQWDSMLT